MDKFASNNKKTFAQKKTKIMEQYQDQSHLVIVGGEENIYTAPQMKTEAFWWHLTFWKLSCETRVNSSCITRSFAFRNLICASVTWTLGMIFGRQEENVPNSD